MTTTDPIILQRVTKLKYCQNTETCHYEEVTQEQYCPQCGSVMITRTFVPDVATTGLEVLPVEKSSPEMDAYYRRTRLEMSGLRHVGTIAFTGEFLLPDDEIPF